MRPLIIAHRGASHLAPENTLTAFRLAKTLGADGFECDVQITRDRHLVVAHDYLTDLKTPPLAESTIRRKGSSNPLIDTGQLRSSITWQVVPV